MRNTSRILLIQLGDIGDVVLSFPCILALRNHFPDARIVMVVREKAAGLLKDCPWISETLLVKKPPGTFNGWIQYQSGFLRKLCFHRFHMAIDLRTGTRGALISLLSGARIRVSRFAYDGTLWRNRVFAHLSAPDLLPGQSFSDYYLKILTDFGIPPVTRPPMWPVAQKSMAVACDLLNRHDISPERPFLVLQPFSLWPYKELPENTLAELVYAIDSRFSLPVVVAGGPEDRPRADTLCKRCEGTRIVNLAGKTRLETYGGIIKKSRLFMGIDSAGLHIAAALGVPTVGIFGPSSIDAWAPRGDGHRVIHKDMACVPCSRKGCDGSGVSRCLQTLTVDEIQKELWPRLQMLVTDD